MLSELGIRNASDLAAGIVEAGFGKSPTRPFGADEVGALILLGSVPESFSNRINVDLVLIFAPAETSRCNFVSLDRDILGVCGDLLSAREIGSEDYDLMISEFIAVFLLGGLFLVGRAVFTDPSFRLISVTGRWWMASAGRPTMRAKLRA